MMYDDLPIKSGDFPVCYIKQPEGIYLFSVPNVTEVSQGLAEKRRQRARRFVQDASLGSFTSGGISLGGKVYRKAWILTMICFLVHCPTICEIVCWCPAVPPNSQILDIGIGRTDLAQFLCQHMCMAEPVVSCMVRTQCKIKNTRVASRHVCSSLSFLYFIHFICFICFFHSIFSLVLQ